MWDLIQNCLEILGISEEEAKGLWSLLAAIYHLGHAGVKKGTQSGCGLSHDHAHMHMFELQGLCEVLTIS